MDIQIFFSRYIGWLRFLKKLRPRSRRGVWITVVTLLVIIFGGIFGYHFFMRYMIGQFMKAMERQVALRQR